MPRQSEQKRNKHLHPRTGSLPVLVLGVLVAILAAGPAAHAVTAVTVDGHPEPVTLTVGETVTIRFDVATAGGSVQWTLTRDLSGTGKYDPAYPFHRTNPVNDGGADDSDPAPRKIALRFPVLSSVPAGRYVMHLQDNSNGSTVDSPVWTVVPKPEAQAISGRVLIVSDANPTGTPPLDAVIWAATDLQTLIASASIRPDGSYTLPLPSGTYLLFAEWFGNLRSQRQVVQLAADQKQNVDLPLLQGQEVSGTVKVGGQPAADVLVQATAANGRVFATRTFADGTYLFVLPNGQYRIAAPGGLEQITVADGSVDGVDFPARTPGPTPGPGTIITVAGSGASTFGGDGRPAVTAPLPNPLAAAVDADGNLYVVDNTVSRVRKVDAKTGIITTVAGSSTIDAIRFLIPQLGSAGGFAGDGGPATAALLHLPQNMAVDAAGNLYISCTRNHRVRKVDAWSGIITTVAGSGPTGAGRGSFAGDGGLATDARLNAPGGVAVDAAGSLYIADGNNQRVRKVTPDGTITTIAGGGTGAVTDGAKATEVALNRPRSLAVDAAGNLFIGDAGLNRILKVSPAGIVSLVAGNGTAGLSGDGGLATAAQFNAVVPMMAVDRAGNLYFADVSNQRVRKVSVEGIISTVVGTGEPGFTGDSGPATAARLFLPFGIAIDRAGNLYVVDNGNKRVRKVVGIAAPGVIGGQ